MFHELKVLVDIVGFAGTYDQLNMGAIIAGEAAWRRIQALVETHDKRVENPSWEVAQYVGGGDDVHDMLTAEQRMEATRKAEDRMEIERS